jgi:serine protease Do
MSIKSAALALLFLIGPGILFPRVPSADDSRDSDSASQKAGYLGLAIVGVPESLANELSAQNSKGALVRAVQNGSPAAKAGIQPNDIILGLNNKTLDNAAELGQLVSALPAGRKIRLRVLRQGKTLHLSATLGEWPTPPSIEPHTQIDLPSSEMFFPDMPSPALRWRSGLLGLEYESIDSQLADFFGVKKGILVRFVHPGSIAQQAGLLAGDVLVSINEKPAGSARELAVALQSQQGERHLALGVVRNHKQQAIKIKIGRGDSDSSPWIHKPPVPASH